jgi:hypothetical protein
VVVAIYGRSRKIYPRAFVQIFSPTGGIIYFAICVIGAYREHNSFPFRGPGEIPDILTFAQTKWQAQTIV